MNIDWITQLVDAGYEDQIIIGADTGWFDPGQPAGFEIEQVDGVWTSVGDLAQDYRSVPEEFVPAMRGGRLLRGAHRQAHARQPLERLLEVAARQALARLWAASSTEVRGLKGGCLEIHDVGLTRVSSEEPGSRCRRSGERSEDEASHLRSVSRTSVRSLAQRPI